METYDPRAYPPVAVTVDLVVLTIRESRLCALTVCRGEAPFKGSWALPGGFVRQSEDLAAAAARELYEETGFAVEVVHLEQLASYGDPRRDPRMRVVTVAYLALAPDLPLPTAGSDAAGARWSTVSTLLADPRQLAFDHHRVLTDGVERALQAGVHAVGHGILCAGVHRGRATPGLRGGVGHPARSAQLPPQGYRGARLSAGHRTADHARRRPGGPALPVRHRNPALSADAPRRHGAAGLNARIVLGSRLVADGEVTRGRFPIIDQ